MEWIIVTDSGCDLLPGELAPNVHLRRVPLSILLGEDIEPQIPGLCIVSDRYLVGGGLWGSVALIGPTRMPFQKLMPLLHTFADQLGEGMSGKRKDTPQAAAPRRTVIYKEDLE